MQTPASQYPVPPSETQPKYALAIIAGLAVATITLPLYRWMVAWGYNDGYYTEWPQLLMLDGVFISLAMRHVAGKRGSVRLGVLAGLIALIQLLGSEYLFFHYLISQSLIQEGYQALPVLLPPQMIVAVIIEGLKSDPVRIVYWIVDVAVAVSVAVIKDLAAAPRWSTNARRGGIFRRTQNPQAFPSERNPSTPLSLKIEAIPSEAYVLGAPTHQYSVATRRILATAGVFAAIAVSGIVLGLISTVGRDIFLAGAIFFFLLAASRAALLLINLNNQVLLFPAGLSVTQEGQTTIFRWDQIDRVYQNRMRYSLNGIPIIDIHNYTIEQDNGTKVIVRRWYDKLEELGNLIHQKVTEHQLPRALEALDRNEQVSFGNLYLSRDGLYDGKKLIAWQDIQSVGVWQGSLRIKTKRSLFGSMNTPSISKIPNPHLFFKLAYRFLDQHPPK